jgi:hypothetical protein
MGSSGALAAAADTLIGRLTAGEPALTARLGLPADTTPATAELVVWPLALLPEQGMVGGQVRGALRLRARFLVTAHGPLPASIALLDRVLVREAAAHPAYLAAEQVPTSLWRDLGLRPALGLLFELPVQVARPAVATPLVRGLPRVEVVGLRAVTGRVVGPRSVPLAGMRVAAADGTTATSTDSRGRFVLPGVAADRPVRLHVTGRGRSFAAELPPMAAPPDAAAATETIVITCDLEEAQ